MVNEGDHGDRISVGAIVGIVISILMLLADVVLIW